MELNNGLPISDANPVPSRNFPGYKDLGLAIDTTSLAAGATLYSAWVDDVAWVRNLIFAVQADQNYDVVIQRRGPALNGTMDYSIGITGQTSTNGNHRSHPVVGANGLVGYSFRIGLKNVSANTMTVGKVRAQLLGL